MDGDPRVRELLERLLDSEQTPEEACQSCPELLPQVRMRWERKLACDAQLDAFFPASGSDTRDDRPTSVPSSPDLPRIPGYEVQEVLGRGGMGIVYKARQLRLNRIVALKMLLAGAHAGPESRGRFLREAEAVAALRHPNIVQIYELGDHEGQPYFTMEFAEGGNLAQRSGSVPQPPREASSLVATLAQAVETAHRGGIVHRDLKPSNVLLTVDGTPKISDFGLARRMEEEANLTWTGFAVGTPSYMAPEQAEARSHTWGPAADIYTLGVILYELLTGRPPFRSKSAAETVRQVISQDPVPPSRLNGKVPRDLEIICLKCLHKEPRLRYADAAALSGDLRRFLGGEAIAARPEGRLARLARRVRRRPVISAAAAVGSLIILALLGGWVGLLAERAAARLAVDAERAASERAARVNLGEMVDFMRTASWPEARSALERAKAWMVHGASENIRDRIVRGDRDLELVARLDSIRLPGYASYGQGHDFRESDREYERAFRDAGFDEIDRNPKIVAARVNASDIRNALLVAIDEWSLRTRDPGRKQWASEVARQADRDSTGWHDRALDPAIWKDELTLLEVIDTAPYSEQSVALLLGIELHTTAPNEIRISLLKRIHERHPRDFWVNARLGMVMIYERKYEEAVGYYRTALAIRPDVPLAHGNLGTALWLANRPSEAIWNCQKAIALDPAGIIIRQNLVLVLWNSGRKDEAIRELRLALHLNPRSALLHAFAGNILENNKQDGEALDLYRQAVAIDPKYTRGQRDLRALLLRQVRWDDARIAWAKALDEGPPEHEDWYGYAELCLFLGRESDYNKARKSLITKFGETKNSAFAERTSRTCLLRPASGEELHRAVALAGSVAAIDKATALGYYPFFQFVQGLAEYRQDHFDRAITLMRGEASGVLGPSPRLVLAMALHRSGRIEEARKMLAEAVATFDWSATRIQDQDGWIQHVLRREAETMIVPDYPAILDGKRAPRDNNERLALLGICQFTNRTRALASFYFDAFAADPELTDDMAAGHRYRAARAAALVGNGLGMDGGNVSQEERTRWRRQAQDWLEHDLIAWTARLDSRDAANRRMVQQVLTDWLSDPSQAGLREPDALNKLDPEERESWIAFWKKVQVLLELANRA